MNKRIFHIPVFVPHKGCPHDCVFCNQHRITGQIEDMTAGKAKQVIDKHLKSIESNYQRSEYYAEIAFFGGSFTAIELEIMTELLELAHTYVKDGRADGIRCSTRPDCINSEVLELCRSYSMTAIELGVQSADEDVLLASARGHTFEHTRRAAEMIHSYGFELGLQMMTGLPGDTPDKSLRTARLIAELRPKAVRIYPTLVMEGTHLWDMYAAGDYKPQTVDEAVDLAVQLVKLFKEHDIEILRIGLQTTDNVNKSTVIGPYHAAFAELVYGRIARDETESYIVENNIRNCNLKIEVSADRVSQLIGHKRENARYFEEKYGVRIKPEIKE